MLITAVLGIALAGCVEDLIKPDMEIRAITPEKAAEWGEENKDKDNARLFIIHSSDMKKTAQWLVGFGIDVPWIKSEHELASTPLSNRTSSSLSGAEGRGNEATKKGQKQDAVSPPDK